MSSKVAFWTWLAASMLFVLLVAVAATSWMTRHALLGGTRLDPDFRDAVLIISEFPGNVVQAAIEARDRLVDEPSRLLHDRSAVEEPHWRHVFPAPDPGYLLLSALDSETRRSAIRLIRISDGQVMMRWSPDWKAILARIPAGALSQGWTEMNAIATHPLLLADGDIVFNFAGAMIRMGACEGGPRWILNEALHHSIERGPDGNLWTLSVASDAFADNTWLRERVRDDAVAQVSPEGRLINRWSFVRTMMDNGLQALLLGTQGEQLNDDPLHLNHVAVASADGPHWRRGDLLVSARHRSTLFLFRPSTGEIVWHQTGPWMAQHSVAFLDDYRISVFSNNAVLGVPEPQAFLAAEGTGRFMIFDFATRTVAEPFHDLLAAAKVRTVTGGLAQLLPDGGLFVEETAKGRHLRFTRSELMWSRINYFDAGRIGAVEWSRYLTPQQAASALGTPSLCR
jgi:hypothetical protein